MATEYRVLRQRRRNDDHSFAVEYIGFSEGSALMHRDSLLHDLAGKGVSVWLEARHVDDWRVVPGPTRAATSRAGEQG